MKKSDTSTKAPISTQKITIPAVAIIEKDRRGLGNDKRSRVSILRAEPLTQSPEFLETSTNLAIRAMGIEAKSSGTRFQKKNQATNRAYSLRMMSWNALQTYIAHLENDHPIEQLAHSVHISLTYVEQSTNQDDYLYQVFYRLINDFVFICPDPENKIDRLLQRMLSIVLPKSDENLLPLAGHIIGLAFWEVERLLKSIRDDMDNRRELQKIVSSSATIQSILSSSAPFSALSYPELSTIQNFIGSSTTLRCLMPASESDITTFLMRTTSASIPEHEANIIKTLLSLPPIKSHMSLSQLNEILDLINALIWKDEELLIEPKKYTESEATAFRLSYSYTESTVYNKIMNIFVSSYFIKTQLNSNGRNLYKNSLIFNNTDIKSITSEPEIKIISKFLNQAHNDHIALSWKEYTLIYPVISDSKHAHIDDIFRAFEGLRNRNVFINTSCLQPQKNHNPLLCYEEKRSAVAMPITITAYTQFFRGLNNLLRTNSQRHFNTNHFEQLIEIVNQSQYLPLQSFSRSSLAIIAGNALLVLDNPLNDLKKFYTFSVIKMFFDILSVEPDQFTEQKLLATFIGLSKLDSPNIEVVNYILGILQKNSNLLQKIDQKNVALYVPLTEIFEKSLHLSAIDILEYFEIVRKIKEPNLEIYSKIGYLLSQKSPTNTIINTQDLLLRCTTLWNAAKTKFLSSNEDPEAVKLAHSHMIIIVDAFLSVYTHYFLNDTNFLYDIHHLVQAYPPIENVFLRHITESPMLSALPLTENQALLKQLKIYSELSSIALSEPLNTEESCLILRPVQKIIQQHINLLYSKQRDNLLPTTKLSHAHKLLSVYQQIHFLMTTAKAYHVITAISGFKDFKDLLKILQPLQELSDNNFLQLEHCLTRYTEGIEKAKRKYEARHSVPGAKNINELWTFIWRDVEKLYATNDQTTVETNDVPLQKITNYSDLKQLLVPIAGLYCDHYNFLMKFKSIDFDNLTNQYQYETLLCLAKCFKNMRMPQYSIDIHEKLNGLLNPLIYEEKAILERSHVLLADYYIIVGLPSLMDKAKNIYKTLLEHALSRRTYLKVIVSLAKCYVASSQLSAAANILLKAYPQQMGIDNPDILWSLFLIYDQQEKSEEAKNICRQLCEFPTLPQYIITYLQTEYLILLTELNLTLPPPYVEKKIKERVKNEPILPHPSKQPIDNSSRAPLPIAACSHEPEVRFFKGYSIDLDLTKPNKLGGERSNLYLQPDTSLKDDSKPKDGSAIALEKTTINNVATVIKEIKSSAPKKNDTSKTEKNRRYFQPYDRAVLFLKRKQYKKAAKIIENFDEANPTKEQSLLGVEVYKELPDSPKAYEYITTQLQRFKNYPQINIVAMEYFVKYRHETAITHYFNLCKEYFSENKKFLLVISNIINGEFTENTGYLDLEYSIEMTQKRIQKMSTDNKQEHYAFNKEYSLNGDEEQPPINFNSQYITLPSLIPAQNLLFFSPTSYPMIMPSPTCEQPIVDSSP